MLFSSAESWSRGGLSHGNDRERSVRRHCRRRRQCGDLRRAVGAGERGAGADAGNRSRGGARRQLGLHRRAFRVVYHGGEDLARLIPDMNEAELRDVDFGTYTEEQYFDDMGRLTQYRCDPDMTEILIRRSFETG